MLNKCIDSDTIITEQKPEHYMNLQIDPLDNPLTTRPNQTGWEISIKL